MSDDKQDSTGREMVPAGQRGLVQRAPFLVARALRDIAEAESQARALQAALGDIFEAVRGGDVEWVRAILRIDPAKANARDKAGETPLLLAIQGKHEAVVETLLLNGAEPNHPDSDGWRPLYSAVGQDNERMVHLLLSHGADPDALPGKETETAPVTHTHVDPSVWDDWPESGAALHLAASRGCLPIVQILLAKNASVNQGSWVRPLDCAVGRGHAQVTAALLDNGADIGPGAEHKYRPVHLAALCGHAEVVQVLLEHGESVEAMDAHGARPLHWAALGGHVSVIELLLGRGADPNVPGTGWEHWIIGVIDAPPVQVVEAPPLLWAAAAGKPEAVDLLLHKGSGIGIRDSQGSTALHLAASACHMPVLRLLLGRGADVRCENDRGDTPLHAASISGMPKVVEFLLENGAPVNGVNAAKPTPLHQAAYYGHSDVVRLLLAKGAQPNATMEFGWTPLHWAAGGQSRVSVVEALLKYGADANAQDVDGITPLRAAIQEGQKDIAELLRLHGARE